MLWRTCLELSLLPEKFYLSRTFPRLWKPVSVVQVAYCVGVYCAKYFCCTKYPRKLLLSFQIICIRLPLSIVCAASIVRTTYIVQTTSIVKVIPSRSVNLRSLPYSLLLPRLPQPKITALCHKVVQDWNYKEFYSQLRRYPALNMLTRRVTNRVQWSSAEAVARLPLRYFIWDTITGSCYNLFIISSKKNKRIKLVYDCVFKEI